MSSNSVSTTFNPLQQSITPKATLSLKNIWSGEFNKNVGRGIVVTHKIKKGNLNASIGISNNTVIPLSFSELKKTKDVLLTTDYKINKKVGGGGLTANAKYELGPKFYTVGATWDGPIAEKTSMIKGWYTNKDNLFAGEASMAINSNNRVNCTFNQNQALTAKYTFVKGSLTIEPSYSFKAQAPAIALTKKVGKKGDTLKLSHDIKSEATALEFAHRPLKFTVATTAGRSLNFAKPTITCVFENQYNL